MSNDLLDELVEGLCSLERMSEGDKVVTDLRREIKLSFERKDFCDGDGTLILR